jgi:hypothetical protein
MTDASNTTTISSKHSLKTVIKRAFIDNFNHVISDPPVEHLNELYNQDYFCFKYANKSFAANFAIPYGKEYFTAFYKDIGTPYIYGMYNHDTEKNTDTIIGTLTMIHRHDNRVLQIIDVKIKKEWQGRGLLNTLISATLPIRVLKNTGYYIISMNPNPRIDSICKNMIMTRMKHRGKMLIFIVSFEQITRMLSYLQTFYSSDIGFVNNNNRRNWYDTAGKKHIKLLHLHHNALYRQFDFREPQRGYQYCFAIHEEQEFILKGLKDEFNAEPCASANIFTNNFKTDWSKFIKTSEI